MKLFEEFRLFETMWDSVELVGSDEELTACLLRVNKSARRRPEFDPNEAPMQGRITVALTRSDLEKALKIGDGGLSGGFGTPAPAKLIDFVELIFWYNTTDDNDPWTHLSLRLGGNEAELAKIFDVEIKVGDMELSQHFQSDAEAEEYFNTNIVPKADQLASEIINEVWAAENIFNSDGYDM